MPPLKKPSNRNWFRLGGRHAISNRIADFGPVLDGLDLSAMTAADVGAAEGDITQWMLDRFARVEAHELMDKAYAELAQRFATVTEVTTHQTDIARSPLSGPYDVVFLLGVLHCFTDEQVRRRVLLHCLENAQHLCLARTAIRDLRQSENRRMERAHRYTTLRTFLDAAGETFDLCVINNGYRGTEDLRLGDLVIYRRRVESNPLPSLDVMFSATRGYINRDAVENEIQADS